MAVTYAEGTELEALDPVALAMRLGEVMAAAMPWLERVRVSPRRRANGAVKR